MPIMSQNIQKAFAQATTRNVWGDYFANGYAPDSYADLRIKAEALSTEFFQQAWPSFDDLKEEYTNPELDAWVDSKDGQTMLSLLVWDIQSHIDSVKAYALPAHDIRQILFKDASEALRFYQMERPEGYKSTFVIPTFSHDIGRLLEGRFYHPDNAHEKWIPHSKFSYVLFNDILSKDEYKDMPKELKNHFLYAVLAHSGENGKTFMSRAVQACDRMQLIGPEGFFRAHAYGLCFLDADIKYPNDDVYKTDLPIFGKHHSVLSELEFFARNMRKNIGTDHKEWQKRIAVENVALLLKISERDDDLRRRVFFPEYNTDITAEYGPAKRPIAPDIFYDAHNKMSSFDRLYTNFASADDVVGSLRLALECLPGAAQLSDAMVKSAYRAVDDLTHNTRHALYDTIRMANILRMDQDKVDVHYAVQSLNDRTPEFIRLVADTALKYEPSYHDYQLGHDDKLGGLPSQNMRI